MKINLVLVLLLFTSIAHTQGRSGASTQGSLTVTATVESSVWLVAGADGKQELVVANAPDAKESFHHQPILKRGKALQSVQAAAQRKSVTPQGQQDNQHEAAVVYSFPTAPRQFDVTQETRAMKLPHTGKVEHQTVTVITVVAR